MRTKTAITESELVLVRKRLKKYRESQVKLSECIFDLAEILDCKEDYAHELLEQSMLAENILYDEGLEIAPDEPPKPNRPLPAPGKCTPLSHSLRVVDYEEEAYFPRTIGSVEIVLACVAVAAFIAVIAGAGVAWDWVWGGEW